MNRQERRAATARKETGQFKAKYLTRRQRQSRTAMFVICGIIILLNFAARVMPTLTGRCFSCVVTGNYQCDVLKGNHSHSHPPPRTP